MYEKFRERKSSKTKSKKDGIGAFEIYHRTHFLTQPVLLWIPHACKGLIAGSKKEAIYKALENKPAGLYFFTPGVFSGKIELFKLNIRVLSAAEYALKFLRKNEKSFQKKFGCPMKWLETYRKRISFLKKVNNAYQSFNKDGIESLFLEETVYFATDDRYKPSLKLSINELNKSSSNLAKICLAKKYLKSDLNPEIYKLVSTNNNVPAALLHRYIFKYKIPPRLLSSVFQLNKKIAIESLEELRLQGKNLNLEKFKWLTSLLSELSNYMRELNLRSCLAAGFIRKVYLDKDSYFPKNKDLSIDWKKFKQTVRDDMNLHLEGRGFNFSASNITPVMAIEWFLGKLSDEDRLNFYLPGLFLNQNIRERFFNVLQDKCEFYYKNPDHEWLMKVFIGFAFLLDRDESSDNAQSLISIISQCREFCPPGVSGNEALQIVCLIFHNMSKLPKEDSQYLLDNIPYYLTEILTVVLNKNLDGGFTVPTYEKIEKTLGRIIEFLPKLKNLGIDLDYFLVKNRLFTMLYLFEVKPIDAAVWMLQKGDDWIDIAAPNKSDWWYVFDTKEVFRSKLLEWADILEKEKVKWSEIAETLYAIRDKLTDKNFDQFTKNFHIADRLYKLSCEVDKYIKENRSNEYSNVFSELTDFITYIDTIPNGWDRADEYFEVYAKHIKNYVKVYIKSEDFDLVEDEDRLKWISLLTNSPQDFKKYLYKSPIHHFLEFEVTLCTMIWIKQKFPDIFNFFSQHMVSGKTIKTVFRLLRSIKVAKRLNNSEINFRLNSWLECLDESDLKELKNFRRLAGYEIEYPKSIRKNLNLIGKYKAEVEALEKRQELPESAEIRLKKLKKLIKDPEKVDQIQSELIAKYVADAIDSAKIEALEKMGENICFDHIKNFTGCEVSRDSHDWLNALHLSFSAKHNRRVLKKLMINAAHNDHNWIYQHNSNISFLEKTGHEFNLNAWMNPPEKKFIINDCEYEVSAEKNLLKVLHMGNYFGSCLSVGDFNDYSTIANAVEVNKHVLWIKNKNDKVIGRKLIVMDKKLNLYGYNSYGLGSGKKENQWILILFDIYCLELAKKAGLKLSNKYNYDDDPLNLFTKWYDDGTENFDPWVLELEKGKNFEDLAKKYTCKNDPQYLRAALWLHYNGVDIEKSWNHSPSFTKALEVKTT